MITKRDLLTPLSILIAGAMISGATVWSNMQLMRGVAPSYMAGDQAGAAAPGSENADIARVSASGRFIGDESAPVALAYWFDYQCPYCKSLDEMVLQRLVENYVKPGKLKIYFKDFQFLGPDSQVAGLTARAIWALAPDKYYDWHKAMFSRQDDENGGWGNAADVAALTRSILGSQADAVAAAMTAREAEFRQGMDEDAREGNAMGVNGTPGVIIGKKLLVGSRPYEEVRAAIEEQLATR